MNKTSEKIIEYISKKGQASGRELADYFGITDRAVRKQLRSLFESGKIKKIGKPPKVFYTLPEEEYEGGSSLDQLSGKISVIKIPREERKIIENKFLYINSKGERFDGMEAFVKWCQDRSFDVENKANEYVRVHNKYNNLRKNGLISGKEKIKDTFGENSCLNNIFYAEFYAWEIFGKTRLGQLLLYGKQSQDKKIISEISETVKPYVDYLIKKYEIDAVGFIPPTVKREVQFMKVLERNLSVAAPVIKIEKAKTDIVTPQKTLSKLQERIDNANHSMFATDTRSFSNILLIDDAVGSGASMNQVACKIKRAGLAKKVYGFAVTGSAKGFDVISEV